MKNEMKSNWYIFYLIMEKNTSNDNKHFVILGNEIRMALLIKIIFTFLFNE